MTQPPTPIRPVADTREILANATSAFDGGARSFPQESDKAFQDTAFHNAHTYKPPNRHYTRFLARAFAGPTDRDEFPRSAGWVIPTAEDDASCKPVFIAHSLLAAIWLVKETLEHGDNEFWAGLVHDAIALTGGIDELRNKTPEDSDEDISIVPVEYESEDENGIPPSAQRPRFQVVPSRKRAAQSQADQSSPVRAKRLRQEQQDAEDSERDPHDGGSTGGNPAGDPSAQPDEDSAESSDDEPVVPGRHRSATVRSHLQHAQNDLTVSARVIDVTVEGEEKDDEEMVGEDDAEGGALETIAEEAQSVAEKEVGEEVVQEAEEEAEEGAGKNVNGGAGEEVEHEVEEDVVAGEEDAVAGGEEEEQENEGRGEDDGPPQDATMGQEIVHVTTVTNNNRRAEVRRIAIQQDLRIKRRHLIGLQAPVADAPREEQEAYDNMAKGDETTIAWLISRKVDSDRVFYTSTNTPYAKATSFLAKARQFGNASSQYNAQQFLQNWRRQGTPFVGRSSDRQSLEQSQMVVAVSSGGSLEDKVNRDFCFAWDMCTKYETAMAAVHISARWAMALLGQAYVRKIEQIQLEDKRASRDVTRNRYGKGQVRSEAIAELIRLVCRSPSRADHKAFRARLKPATRWHTIVQNLGWGSLLLIPHEEMSNRWFERVLRVGELDLFLQLVRKEKPDVCEASRALEEWLGPEGIEGAPITGKAVLSIETAMSAAHGEIYEIDESEDEDDSSGEEDEEDTGAGALEHDDQTAEPQREPSLLDLFVPASPGKGD